MNLVELDRTLRQLRLSGMAAVLETCLRQAQTEKLPPIDLVAALVHDELRRRQDPPRLRGDLPRSPHARGELADATLDGTRKAYLAELATVPLLVIDDLGVRKLAHTAARICWS